MSGQNQLHQLVEKENELAAEWKAALEMSEKEIRDYNNQQQKNFSLLALSPDVTKEIKKIIESGKKEESLIVEKFKQAIEKDFSFFDDNYRQKEFLLLKKLMENFKNKYTM